MTDILIIGSSISANLAAAFLRLEHPELEITIVDRQINSLPIVGESLTEFSTYLLHRIGLATHLEEEHYHKNGLTFYFKENLNDPNCRRYAVHEAPAVPPMPSNQINRFTLDRELIRRNKQNGVKFISGKVTDIDFKKDGNPHCVSIQTNSGELILLNTRWLVDASGRSRVIAKKLKLHREARYQRSSFWFRLIDFDPKLLEKLTAIKPEQWAFDSYYATHHFFGQGNWIWCIPMRSKEHKNMISIGIVWRPGVYQGEVTSVDQFISRVSQEHPVVTDLVKSGSIADTNLYRNYMYESNKLYSEDNWFIIGDAGDTVDPLYSTGLVMTSLQVTQVSAVIRYQINKSLPVGYIQDLETTFKTIKDTLQDEISTLFEVLHDPYQSNWRVHLASVLYFFSLLPSWLSGYMTHPVGVKWLNKAVSDGRQSLMELKKLLALGSTRLGGLPAEKIVNRYYESVNWKLWKGEELRLPSYLSQMFLILAKYRLILLRNAGWVGWPRQAKLLFGEISNALMMSIVFRNRSLANSRLIKSKLKTEVAMNIDKQAYILNEAAEKEEAKLTINY